MNRAFAGLVSSIVMVLAGCSSGGPHDGGSTSGLEDGDGSASADASPPSDASPASQAGVTQFPGESFLAISGTADADIWAVGHASTSLASGGGSGSLVLICPIDRSAQAVVRHYDGVSWTRMEGVSDTQLLDIWAGSPSDVWAVGMEGVVSHYDGTSWTQSSVADLTGVDLSDPCHEVSFHAVWGSGPSDVWAVGYAYPSSLGPTLVMHYDGSSWTRAPVTDLDGLFDVWGTSSTDVWVVGSSGITHHFDGTSWSKVDGATQLYRFGVWGAASDDVWAVGNGGSISHYDGTSWTLLRSPGWEQFEAVWGASASNVWTVGARSEQGMPMVPLALHWDGQAWSEQTLGEATGFSDVWVSSTGQAWSVSYNGIIRLVPERQ